jgi:hypothetical protein
MTSRTKEEKTSEPIDRKSYILGMITAFAECVANECKKVALSPPFYPQDHRHVATEAERIAREQGIFLWYDENLDIPAGRRLNWFVLYKFSDVLDEYRHLRRQGFNPAWHFEKFSDLLSYGSVWGHGADKVANRMRESKTTQDTFARVLLEEGDWPVPKG